MTVQSKFPLTSIIVRGKQLQVTQQKPKQGFWCRHGFHKEIGEGYYGICVKCGAVYTAWAESASITNEYFGYELQGYIRLSELTQILKAQTH